MMGIVGCQNDLADQNILNQQGDIITVAIPGADSRTEMDDLSVLWSQDDAIGVFAGTENRQYNLTDGVGTKTGTFQWIPAGGGLVLEATKLMAYYPYQPTATWDKDAKTLSLTLPDSYEYKESKPAWNNQAVMAALIASSAQDVVQFKNAGALFAITVKNIQPGYDKAVLASLPSSESSALAMAGAATVSFASGEPTLAIAEGATAKTITINFTAATSGAITERTFYFPVPTGTYPGGIQFSLEGDGKESLIAPAFYSGEGPSMEVKRNSRMAATFIQNDQLTGTVTEQVADAEAATEALAAGKTDVTIKTVAAEGTTQPTLTLPKVDAATAEDARVIKIETLSAASLTIQEDNSSTGTSMKEVTLILPAGTDVENGLIIDAPNTTFKIAVEGETTYSKVIAATAQNTLVVEKGVIITELVVKQGNVRVFGQVDKIVRDASNQNTVIVEQMPGGIVGTLGEGVTLVQNNGVNQYYEVDGNFASVAAAINQQGEGTYFVEFKADATWKTGNAGDGANKCFTNENAEVIVDLKGYSLTMTGAGGFKSQAKVTFQNGTIVDQTAYEYENGETAWEFTYLEFQGAAMTFDQVVFNNTVMFDTEKSVVNNSVFKGKATLASNEPNEYAAWIMRSTELNNCKFESLYRGIKIADKYSSVSQEYVVLINGCTFTNISKKPGVVIDNVTYNNTAPFKSITIKDCTFENVQPGDQGKFIYETDNTEPTVENSFVVLKTAEDLAMLREAVNSIGLANSLADIGFQLHADIDLAGIDWTPIGQTGAGQFAGTFDGNGHTIKNLKINNTDEGGNCATGLFGWLNTAVVKNLTIEGAEVAGHHNVGVIAGYMETSGCTIENCHVSNATINCTHVNDDADGDKCGGIVGHAGNAGVKVKDCTVTNSTISAGRDAGQVVGAAKEANVEGCSATNVTVTGNGSSTGGDHTNSNYPFIREELIGRVL